jgi:hypothetical protein
VTSAKLHMLENFGGTPGRIQRKAGVEREVSPAMSMIAH